MCLQIYMFKQWLSSSMSSESIYATAWLAAMPLLLWWPVNSKCTKLKWRVPRNWRKAEMPWSIHSLHPCMRLLQPRLFTWLDVNYFANFELSLYHLPLRKHWAHCSFQSFPSLSASSCWLSLLSSLTDSSWFLISPHPTGSFV